MSSECQLHFHARLLSDGRLVEERPWNRDGLGDSWRLTNHGGVLCLASYFKKKRLL